MHSIPIMAPAYFSLSILILLCVKHGHCHALSEQKQPSKSIPAIFVFGDSTVDPGNNNYIVTLLKSDFPPYGMDFPKQIPTGRFSNGRLATDFIASYLGIKDFVPPYLDPTLSMEDLISGVSFASAGSGYDPRTANSAGVIDMPTQLQYFREYKARIDAWIGKEEVQERIKRALFVVSAGTNDLSASFTSSSLTMSSASSYQRLVLTYSKKFIQGLYQQGARKIAIVGVPPIGCIPIVITRTSPFSDPTQQRNCIPSLSSFARLYNDMLQVELKALQTNLVNSSIVYADIYTPLEDQIRHPYKYGFEVIDRGCCGTGLIEESVACNPYSFICSDRSKYVFWDAAHPTEKTYRLVFDAVRPAVDLLVNM